MEYVFRNYYGETLDLSSFDMSKVTWTTEMFNNCENLKTIYVSSKWDTSKVTASRNMFYNCKNLPNYNASVYDITKAHTGDGGYLTLKA
jgi:surface protein